MNPKGDIINVTRQTAIQTLASIHAKRPPQCGLVQTGNPEAIGRYRFADNPGAISFCLNLEFHAKIAK